MEGLGGTVHGSFFHAPVSVDMANKPGTTSLENAWTPITAYLNLGYFFYSPNLIWFLIAAAFWFVFPYDLEQDSAILSVLQNRLTVNLFLVYAYFGFWHIALYQWNWASRPLFENREYKLSKVRSNGLLIF